jgi:hypothetical protein
MKKIKEYIESKIFIFETPKSYKSGQEKRRERRGKR